MTTTRRRRSGHGRAAEGQILAIFSMALLVILALTGLALDGGSAFAQRRSQQTAADLAALAAANDYLINQDEASAQQQARVVAGRNGFTHGSGATLVNVTFDTSNGIQVRVIVDADHANAVLGVVGMRSWRVSTEAAALAGFPDTAHAASPFIFSAEAFEIDGTPKYQTPTDFGETNGHVPSGALDFAWTNYGTGNLDTNKVRDMIRGDLVIDKTLDFGEYIGQQNNGNHSALYPEVQSHLVGVEIPVAVVDASGNFVGWSTFRVISASGGSDKTVRGYFISSFKSARLSVSACAANDCPRYLGTYVLKLVD